MIDKHIIEQAQNGAISICTYGLGYLGKRLYKEIPGMFGIKADYFCDSSNEKVESISLEGMKGIYKEDLIKSDIHFLVFILVDDPYDIEIQNELLENKALYTVTLREMAQMDEVMRIFYGDEIFDRLVSLMDYREMN